MRYPSRQVVRLVWFCSLFPAPHGFSTPPFRNLQRQAPAPGRIYRSTKHIAKDHQSALFQKRPSDPNELSLMDDILKDADFLEIRLDATICACFVFARVLIFDMSLPLKQIPGYEVGDLILISNAVSSALALAIFWTIAGLLTRNFQSGSFDFSRLFLTTALAGPLWLGTETIFHWLPSSGGVTETILIGTSGLFAVMSFCRVATSGWQ